MQGKTFHRKLTKEEAHLTKNLKKYALCDSVLDFLISVQAPEKKNIQERGISFESTFLWILSIMAERPWKSKVVTTMANGRRVRGCTRKLGKTQSIKT